MRISIISLLHLFFFLFVISKHVGAVSASTCWNARFLISPFRSHYRADPKSPVQNPFIEWKFKDDLHMRVVSAGCTHAQ